MSEDLTTVDEEVHRTFLAAVVSSGFLEANAELSKAMEEAALFKFGDDLRSLFINCQMLTPYLRERCLPLTSRSSATGQT